MEDINSKDNKMIESDNNGGSWIRGKLLGEGTYGAVYIANSKGEGNGSCPSVMAVKSAEIWRSETLQHERSVMSSLAGCSSVVQCFGAELTRKNDGTVVYNLLLEYGSGGTLADEIERTDGRGLRESEVRWYTRSIVEGLIKIHEAGFVHCDLKPENILLFPTDEKGREFEFQAKICDFGVAKEVNEDRKMSKFKLRRTWNGTAGYVAPEAVKGGLQEPPTDIWSLGIIVLEMLMGCSAWGSDQESETDEDELIRKLQKPACLPEFPEYLSPMAESFLHCCLTRRVKRRATAEFLLRHPFIADIHNHEASTHSLIFRKIGFVFDRLGSLISELV